VVVALHVLFTYGLVARVWELLENAGGEYARLFRLQADGYKGARGRLMWIKVTMRATACRRPCATVRS
jgi:hypothetical protein